MHMLQCLLLTELAAMRPISGSQQKHLLYIDIVCHEDPVEDTIWLVSLVDLGVLSIH